MEISEQGNSAALLGGKFASLADSTRLQILERLLGAEATVSELAASLDVGMPSMSKHLNVLQRGGFVVRRADAQRRRCALDPHGFLDVVSWASHYETVWTDRLDRLGAVLDGRSDR